MKAPALAACLTAITFAAPGRAAPKAASTRAFELTLHTGYGGLLKGARGRSGEISAWNGGGVLAGGLMFRSGYFISPFVDVGYHPIFRSQRRVDLGSAGAAAVVTSELHAIGFTAGPALDLWRLRLKGGIGFYDLRARSTVLGQTITQREIDMGYMAALSGYIVRRARIKVGVEVRADVIVEADLVLLSAGFSLGGDVLSF